MKKWVMHKKNSFDRFLPRAMFTLLVVLFPGRISMFKTLTVVNFFLNRTVFDHTL